MERYSDNRLRLLIGCTALLVACGGCAHKRAHPSSLKDDLNNISEAIEKKDREKFYSMLSEKQKIGINKEDLQKSMKADTKEFKNLSSQLKDPEEIKLEAFVAYPWNEKIKLVLEDDTWKIEEGIFECKKASTPGDACSSLLKKLLILRAVLREETVLGEAYKKILLDSLDKTIEELTGLNANDIVIADNHAFIVFPSGRRIEFVLEEGQWKITRIFPFPLQ